MPKTSYYLPQRRLVSQEDAAQVQTARTPRSRFHNRWTRKTAIDAGILYPFMVDEVLPGDHMRYNVSAFFRMATTLFPLIDNQRIDTHFFFCPARILWINWERFMGAQDNPGDSIAYTVPTVALTNAEAIGSLFDHMGLPVGNMAAAQTLSVNALPFRAYNRIWNDWFRDQNIMTRADVLTDNGPDGVGSYILRRRAKSHDYFTSALPWPQKFTPLTTLFTGVAPITGIGVIAADNPTTAGPLQAVETDKDANTQYDWYYNSPQAAQRIFVKMEATGSPALTTNTPQIYADLARATGVTINALRQAWLVQDLLERDARGGTRYVEKIRAHFNVISPDFRLGRPEYIGGGQTPISINPIAQTATGGGGLGSLAGAGAAVGYHSASYAATEHGYILALASIKSELSYQQGLPKMWSRSVQYDFYFPALAGLGEQAILRQEIYATGTDANDTAVFGYQERWHEYRTRQSEVTGILRSTAAGTIDAWHLAQHFTAAPTLSDTFLYDTPPMTRVLSAGAAANGQQYIGIFEIQRIATRPIPMFGTPATLMRF